MKLYYVPNTRAVRAAWVLEELGVLYERVVLDPHAGDTRTAEYLSVHPMGKVPALVDGDVKLFESGAIALYLADKFPEKQLGAPFGSTERAMLYQWCFFASSTMEEPLMQVMRALKKGDPVSDDTHALIERVWTSLEAGLGDKEYLVGGRFTIADLLVSSGVGWAKMIGVFKDRPLLNDYAKRCTGRPSFAAARKT